jgi:PAS domain-containing protein
MDKSSAPVVIPACDLTLPDAIPKAPPAPDLSVHPVVPEELAGPRKMRNEFAFAVNLVKYLVVPMFVLDPQCKVLIWNIACERLTGIPGSDVIGTSEHWRGFYDTPRPCLADLVALDRASEVREFYAHYEKVEESQKRLYAENW